MAKETAAQVLQNDGPTPFEFVIGPEVEKQSICLWGREVAGVNVYSISLRDSDIPAAILEGVQINSEFPTVAITSRTPVSIRVAGLEDDALQSAQVLMHRRNHYSELFRSIEEDRGEMATLAQVIGLVGRSAEAFIAENVRGAPEYFEKFFWDQVPMKIRGIRYFQDADFHKGWRLGLTHVIAKI